MLQYYHHLAILGPAIPISQIFPHFNNIAYAIYHRILPHNAIHHIILPCNPLLHTLVKCTK